MTTCYRHPDRETGVSCSNCGRPICPDCMTPTSVGMRCPECARQRTEVRTLSSLERRPTATLALIALNVVAFFASTAGGSGLASGAGGTVIADGGLFGPEIAQGHEYWRLITSGFLHGGLLHLAFNMYALYLMGQSLEPSLGRARFLVLYFVSLLAGSFGALLLAPDKLTVGASGAVFGLFAGAFVAMRARGFDPMASGLGGVIAINLLITFAIPGIAIGGHLGGLVGGALVAYLLVDVGERRRSPSVARVACGGRAGGARVAYLLVDVGERRRSPSVALVACAVLAALAVAGSLAVAGGSGLG